MKKAELEVALNNKTRELEQFKSKVVDALKKVIDNTCSDADEHIESFCNDVGIPPLRQKVLVSIPYGREIEEIQDSNYDEIEFEILETDVQ